MPNFKNLSEFNGHETVVVLDEPNIGLKGYIAIHRKLRPNPSFGATRIVPYKNETDALKDALRLSRLMSYKSTMAQLPYGGAKAALIEPKGMTAKQKKLILEAYADKVNELHGQFITGADVGIDDNDLMIMRQRCPFMVGLKSQPVMYTALGLFYSLEVALKEQFGNKSISGRSFAIQGVGKVGSYLLELIYKQAKKIFIADINAETLKTVKQNFPKITIVDPLDICCQDVDVFAPCALSHSLNTNSVGRLKCKIVAGSANNQLENPDIGTLLHKQGILYAPDYVANAGGLISVTDEFENQTFDKKRLDGKVKKISETIKNIFEASKRTNKPTNFVADEMAEAILNKKYAKQKVAAGI